MCEEAPTVVPAMLGVVIIAGGGYVAIKQWRQWRAACNVQRECEVGTFEENIPLYQHSSEGTQAGNGDVSSSMSRSSSMVTVATQFSASDESFECLVTSPSMMSDEAVSNKAPRRGWFGWW